MNPHSPSIIQRAFELAAQDQSLDTIRRTLSREGYVDIERHLAGSHIKLQLKKARAGIIDPPASAPEG